MIFENLNYEKECPMCAEKVKFKAKICRFCGYKFDKEIKRE
ncbi:zinc ribbon domain-containing protein [Clostridium sp.]|nr:zinc ribbon domain-containing protein [Clostridium sp.]MDR3597684.1 zinc ribbon domain-containing protein [Clostridium sp.]